MGIKRITISVPAEVAGRIKTAAGDQAVSSWLTTLVESHLDDASLEQRWREYYESVKPRASDIRKANALFARLTGKSTKRRAA